MMTIGIPRSMLYHRNDVLWPTFLGSLGHETVVSAPTNRRVVDCGGSLAVDESCLPMKILLGHVDALRGRADAVLVPRYVSVDGDESMCVKYWASPDIARNVFDDVKVIDFSVDSSQGDTEERAMRRLGKELGGGYFAVRKAYAEARRLQDEADKKRQAEALARLEVPADMRVLVVAHSYNLRDEMLGKPITRFLENEGVDVVYSDAFEGPEWAARGRELSPGMYWTYNAELLGAVQHCRDKVDGIVFIVTFPCGPDSLMTELATRKISEVPTLVIVLDELQAEAGLRTRLESFVDIVRMRKGAAVS